MVAINSRACILESDEGSRRALGGLLKCHGYQTTEESDSDRAIRFIAEEVPGVIVISGDIIAEDSDLLHIIRRLTDGIVIIVGNGSDYSATSSLLQGADMYFSRPVAHRILVARLRRLRRRLIAAACDAQGLRQSTL